MSNLITMATQQSDAPATSTVTTKLADVLLITSTGGSQFVIDRINQTYKEVRVATPLQGIVTPCQYGRYWTLRPDPPTAGEDLRIFGPRHDDPNRTNLIELSKIVEPYIADE